VQKRDASKAGCESEARKRGAKAGCKMDAGGCRWLQAVAGGCRWLQVREGGGECGGEAKRGVARKKVQSDLPVKVRNCRW
jgi:hypothetical protein